VGRKVDWGSRAAFGGERCHSEKRFLQPHQAAGGGAGGAAGWKDLGRGCQGRNTITLPAADAFSFLGGNLCSDYMDQDEIQFTVSKGSTPILPPHYRQNGIIGLLLRMAHVARSFTLNVKDLRQESEATKSAAWAGIKIFEAESPLFLAMPANSWGNLFYPLLYQPNRVEPCTASHQGCDISHHGRGCEPNGVHKHTDTPQVLGHDDEGPRGSSAGGALHLMVNLRATRARDR